MASSLAPARALITATFSIRLPHGELIASRWLRCVFHACLLGCLLSTAAAAVDHNVIVRCRNEGGVCRVDLVPDTLVVVAGRDRVLWSIEPPCDYSVCIELYELMTVSACFGPYPQILDCVSLRLDGTSSVARGPFCSAGMFPYWLDGRGSHGQFIFARSGVLRVDPPNESASHASDASVALPWIGIFSDSLATSCLLPKTAGWHRAWIYAMMGEPGNCPLAGAAFRVAHFPVEWSTILQPNPAATVLTNDVFGLGARLTFPACHGTGGRILLYTVDYAVQGSADPYVVDIDGVLNESSKPQVVLCGGSNVAASGARGFFDPIPACPQVSVSPGTWGEVKRRFR